MKNQSLQDQHLLIAVSSGDYDKTLAAIAVGANVNATDCNNNSALAIASSNDDFRLVDLLLSRGSLLPNAEVATLYNRIVFANVQAPADVIAIKFDCSRCFPSLLKKRLEICNHDAKSVALEQLAKLAIYFGAAGCLDLLLHSGAKIDLASDLPKETAFKSILFGRFDLLRLLVAPGFDVNVKSRDGDTLAMTAASHGRAECLKILIEAGANVHLKNANGITALEFAEKYEKQQAKQVLGFANLDNQSGRCREIIAAEIARTPATFRLSNFIANPFRMKVRP